MSDKSSYEHGAVGNEDGECGSDSHFHYKELGAEKVQVDEADEEIVVDIDVESAASDELYYFPRRYFF